MIINRILSADNAKIKLAASLKNKKYRDETGSFAIEGLHLVSEAIASFWNIQFVLVIEEQIQDGKMSTLLQQLLEAGPYIFSVSASLYKKVSDTEAPQGILAVVNQTNTELPEVLPQGSSVWVVLDAIQDPGNVGTIVRNADAAGATGVILTPGCADIYSGKSVRATMGSLFHLPLFKATVPDCLEFFQKHGLGLYVAGAEAAVSYTDVDFSRPCAVVFGNEGGGVGEEFRRHALLSLRIPILGKAESLNVSSAAAVILFETARQRGFSL